MKGVKCNGSERDINDCQIESWTDDTCDISERANIYCTSKCFIEYFSLLNNENNDQ